MSVALSSTLPLQSSAPELLNNNTGKQSALPSERLSAKPQNTDSAPIDPSKQSGETRVTLARETPGNHRYSSFSAPYAEVWRNGVKIAVIDATGGVTAVNGLVASVPGSADQDGPLLAARRAAQIAAATGGEVKIAGEAIDRETLGMRARLQVTYGKLQ